MIVGSDSVHDELLLQQQQCLQTENEPDMEQEIECPRCHDTMSLCSDIYSISY
jgi:hypothetical protein